jgi:hypothetical protein
VLVLWIDKDARALFVLELWMERFGVEVKEE